MFSQRRDRNIRNVVHVDNRFTNLACRQRYHAGQGGFTQITFAEVLCEPGGSNECVLESGVPHDILAALRVILTPSRQQDQAIYTDVCRDLRQRLDAFFSTRVGHIREVSDVNGLNACERGMPRFRILPVERRRRAARPVTHGVAKVCQLCSNT